jgi:hypothetical protein
MEQNVRDIINHIQTQIWHDTGDEHQFGLHVVAVDDRLLGGLSTGVVGGVNSVGRTENGSSYFSSLEPSLGSESRKLKSLYTSSSSSSSTMSRSSVLTLNVKAFPPLFDLSASSESGGTGTAQPCLRKLLSMASFLRDLGGGDEAFKRIVKRWAGNALAVTEASVLDSPTDILCLARLMPFEESSANKLLVRGLFLSEMIRRGNISKPPKSTAMLTNLSCLFQL